MNNTPLFSLGRLLATPGALDLGINFFPYILRHQTGDWGNLCDDDKQANETAVREGYRIFSAYHPIPDTKIWIITEFDRSATTILLPSEY